jgi:hypothetical protein
VAALKHAVLPGEELGRRNAGLARPHGKRSCPAAWLPPPAEPSRPGPAPTALYGGDHFDPSKRLIGTLGHSRTHRRVPYALSAKPTVRSKWVHSTSQTDSISADSHKAGTKQL